MTASTSIKMKLPHVYVFVFGASLVSLLYMARVVQTGQAFPGIVRLRSGSCEVTCGSHDGDNSNSDSTRTSLLPNVDLLERQELVRQVKEAQQRMIDEIKIDYGEDNYQNMFLMQSAEDHNHKNYSSHAAFRPFIPITNGGHSYESLKRKLQIKVLSVQSQLLEQRKTARSCGCSKSASTALREMPEKYVFATGGNSVGAAHGNLFNESHTAYLERRVQGVFGSIGIAFEGRNYAMGSQSSAPEDPMCFEQIFGNDVDFFCWDYSITDQKKYYMLLFSAYRAGISSGKPAFLARQVFGYPRVQREIILRQLEAMGLPTFYEDQDLWDAMKDAIPETQGRNSTEISAMPEYVRAFKCGGFLEKGDPNCGDEKYTKYICDDRQRQTPWHPG